MSAGLLGLALPSLASLTPEPELMQETVTVGPQTYWDFLAVSFCLSELVKRIVYNTRNFSEVETQSEDGAAIVEDWRRLVSPGFFRSLAAAGRFPQFQRVVVRFSAHCSSDHRDVDRRWSQNSTFRRQILEQFFEGLWHAGVSGHVHALDICFGNAQNVNPPFMSQHHVRATLVRLSALRLYIVTECWRDLEDQDDGNSLALEEPHTFMAELPRLWLRPASVSSFLTTLVLYQDIPFGFCPRLRLRGVHFPHLKSLTLGNLHLPARRGGGLDHQPRRHPRRALPRRPDPGLLLGHPQLPPRRFTDLTFARIAQSLQTFLPRLARFDLGRSGRVSSSDDGTAPAYHDLAEYRRDKTSKRPPHERIATGVDREMYRVCIQSKQGHPPFFFSSMAAYGEMDFGWLDDHEAEVECPETQVMEDFEEPLRSGVQLLEDNFVLQELRSSVEQRGTGLGG